MREWRLAIFHGISALFTSALDLSGEEIVSQQPMQKASKIQASLSAIQDISWLGDVREVRHLITQARPLCVSAAHITSGAPLPCPVMPQPEWHPYCELSCILEGRITQYVGSEKLEKKSGDVMLLGSGMPHYATYLSYPLRYVTVYFLPMLLFQLGPEGDGARVLSRFTGPKRLADRIIRPPSQLSRTISGRFEQMAVEFSAWSSGSELRLRALLIEVIVDLLRWEESVGRKLTLYSANMDWLQVEKALRFIHEYYKDSLYTEQIARAAGLSVAHLQKLFQQAFGMSCVKYVRSYRIFRATALLHEPSARVTEVAAEVGFESLSHFNTSFRSFLGTTPSRYMSACRADPTASRPAQ